MPGIRSLRPNVTRAAAIEQFASGGVAGRLWRFQSGPLRAVADVYVPFRVYQVQILNGGAQRSSFFALDGVNGSLDPYEFPRVPSATETLTLETRNRLEPFLEETRARELLVEKLRRLVFQQGFFRIRDLRIRVEPMACEVHVPYWLGFYGRGEPIRLRVIDAVRGRFEGAKARAFFESWLTQQPC